MAIDKIIASSLADNAITSDKIAPGAVTINDIPDGEITLAKLSEVDLNIAPEVLEIQVSAPAASLSLVTALSAKLLAVILAIVIFYFSYLALLYLNGCSAKAIKM